METRTEYVTSNNDSKIAKDGYRKHELVKIAEEKDKKYKGEKEDFCSFESKDYGVLFQLSGEFTLFMYLITSVNRSLKENEWANLDKYYRDKKLLVTARTQNYLADKFGVNQSTISRWLKKLVYYEFIKFAGKEELKLKNGEIVSVTVWALGEIVEVGLNSYEVLYYETAPIKNKEK